MILGNFHRKRIIIGLLGWSAGGLVGAEKPHAPVIPGLHQKHPLSTAQSGSVLIDELGCAACHDGMANGNMKKAPNLAGVGTRLSPEYIQRYIADPAATHPGTTMPDMLVGETVEKRQEISESISHYLRSLQEAVTGAKKSTKSDAKAGHTLFHEIGCIACHSQRDDAGNELVTEGVVSLAHVPSKYRSGALAEFLRDPLKVRPSGRMPDMNLTNDEASSLALYLSGAATADVPDLAIPTVQQVAEGKNNFKKWNCVACHQPEQVDQDSSAHGPALSKLNLSAGCLSPQPKDAPNFHLNQTQRTAIQAALQKPAASPTSADQIKMRLTQLSCIACHNRDDYGGVSPEIDGFFHSTEEALGNEARIPPPLTLVGAKLRPAWMNKVLYDGEVVRPYMKTRMPQFGESSLKGLSEFFAEVDSIEEVDLPAPDRVSKPKMRNGAHLLLGNKGLSCIACHNYNGKESPGMKGLDLMTSYQRLQPSWFYHYMKNPGAFRPGIIMPSYWPNDKAVQTEILGGDTELQLQALWHNFSLGRSARDPSGLRTEPTKLKVSDKTRTYRGRSKIAGYRGIAVGFPGGMNYAFSAQNGALSGIWQGEFVSVNWQSQGSGNFSPASSSVQLAQDVAFLQLSDEKAAWPLYPKRSKEQPINSDPLYPRKHGYAFTGYYFDDAFVPTFMYKCGSIAIEDKSVSAKVDGGDVLRRTFHFSTATQEVVYFRALTGAITMTAEKDDKKVFKTKAVAISIATGDTILRPASLKENGQELLIRLSLPKGKSSHTIDYTLLK